MPNYVSNKLIIQCTAESIMQEIKDIMKNKDSESSEIITMQNLIPSPENKFTTTWATGDWGTKWDMFNTQIGINKKSKLGYAYDTAWRPNDKWVEVLCNYIDLISFSENTTNDTHIAIEHYFYDWISGGFGGFMKWKPGEKIIYHFYGIMEFMYLFDKKFHDYLAQNMGYEPFNPEMSKYRDFIEKHVDESFL